MKRSAGLHIHCHMQAYTIKAVSKPQDPFFAPSQFARLSDYILLNAAKADRQLPVAIPSERPARALPLQVGRRKWITWQPCHARSRDCILQLPEMKMFGQPPPSRMSAKRSNFLPQNLRVMVLREVYLEPAVIKSDAVRVLPSTG